MITLAKKLAKKSKCRCKHGSVVAKGNRVYGMGCNSYKEHPTWGGGPLLTLHAEAAAIRDAQRRGVDLKGKNLYVVRIDSQSAMSRPCKSCQRLIEEVGIRKVYYTDKNGNIIQTWP